MRASPFLAFLLQTIMSAVIVFILLIGYFKFFSDVRINSVEMLKLSLYLAISRHLFITLFKQFK